MTRLVHCYNPPTDAELGYDAETDDWDHEDNTPAFPLDPGVVDYDARTVPQPEHTAPTRLDAAA